MSGGGKTEIAFGGILIVIAALFGMLILAGMSLSNPTSSTIIFPKLFHQAAYGQQFEFEPQGAITLDPADENTAMLISEVMNKLQNLAQNQTETLWFVGVHGDGSLNIRFDNGTSGNLDDDTTITTKHSYIPENGYTFRDSNIFKPDGTELFAPD